VINVDISKGIKVGGFDYTVDTGDRAFRMVDADGDYGQCDNQNHIISLNTKVDVPLLSKVFLHEVIEAVNYIYCDNKIEHEKIQQLSFGLHQVCESLGLRFGSNISP
jgi:hypothetical protein